jgi:hypothetical protein
MLNRGSYSVMVTLGRLDERTQFHTTPFLQVFSTFLVCAQMVDEALECIKGSLRSRRALLKSLLGTPRFSKTNPIRWDLYVQYLQRRICANQSIGAFGNLIVDEKLRRLIADKHLGGTTPL